MEPILKVHGVCKAFGGVVAADQIAFELQPGEIMGLIGPNGAGKTTLLNLISGIYACDSGEIVFDGRDVTGMPAYKRARAGLARTFQTPRFLQRSDIRDNMLLGTDLADQLGYWKSFTGKKGTSFEDELADLMQYVGFELDWEADISGVPYGQRKLMEIVRAMLTHPKVMLVDEPAAGLNRKEVERVVSLLNYAASRGIGVVLIEHAMDMVMNTCHNILVISFGKVIGYGTPLEVSANPQVIEAYLGKGRGLNA